MFKVEYTKQALKSLQKMDKLMSSVIISWIDKNLDGCENPRFTGKQLKGNLKEFWRYRIGDYRIISIIEDDKLIITIITVGHRREVYR